MPPLVPAFFSDLAEKAQSKIQCLEFLKSVWILASRLIRLSCKILTYKRGSRWDFFFEYLFRPVVLVCMFALELPLSWAHYCQDCKDVDTYHRGAATFMASLTAGMTFYGVWKVSSCWRRLAWGPFIVSAALSFTMTFLAIVIIIISTALCTILEITYFVVCFLPLWGFGKIFKQGGEGEEAGALGTDIGTQKEAGPTEEEEVPPVPPVPLPDREEVTLMFDVSGAVIIIICCLLGWTCIPHFNTVDKNDHERLTSKQFFRLCMSYESGFMAFLIPAHAEAICQLLLPLPGEEGIIMWYTQQMFRFGEEKSATDNFNIAVAKEALQRLYQDRHARAGRKNDSGKWWKRLFAPWKNADSKMIETGESKSSGSGSGTDSDQSGLTSALANPTGKDVSSLTKRRGHTATTTSRSADSQGGTSSSADRGLTEIRQHSNRDTRSTLSKSNERTRSTNARQTRSSTRHADEN